MEHHYVPEWYQRRFLKAGEHRYHYLDMNPAIVFSNGHQHRRNARHKWGPDLCFSRKGLYALKLGNLTSDEIEEQFFGQIDVQGRQVVQIFGQYSGMVPGFSGIFNSLLRYIAAQRFRTVRGLEFIASQVGARSRNTTLVMMQRLYEIYCTMWAECVWEIVFANQSLTKFIVSDEPVAFFNAGVFPYQLQFPSDVPLDAVGTRTLFPLGPEACLIMTHLQLVRNPTANPMRSRINARAFGQTMKAILDIQYGREFEEDEVVRVNYILKRRSVQYVAAAEEQWLYPEKYVSMRAWSKLDHDWFLLPNPYKVPFRSEILVGYKDGGAWGMDEYGRQPSYSRDRDDEVRAVEWTANEQTKREFARKRKGKSIAHVHKFSGDEVYDKIMKEDSEE